MTKKQYEKAIALWEKTTQQKPTFAMAWRNLSIAYYNKHQDGNKALAAMEKVCLPKAPSARFLLEYDQLAARMNHTTNQRLAVLDENFELVKQRDDLFLQYITLLNCKREYQKALEGIQSRRFHPWEGGEGTVSTQYRFALTQLAVAKIAAGESVAAIELLEQAIEYPENLGEGKLPNVPDNSLHYLMGIAYLKAGQKQKADEMFNLATAGDQTPQPVRYYNDQPSDFIYYQGMAYRMLGNEAAAKKSFHQLISYGEKHLFDQIGYDFFAVSLPEIEVYQENTALRHTQYCNYLRALGHLGLGEKEKANTLLKEILQKDHQHQGALVIAVL